MRPDDWPQSTESIFASTPNAGHVHVRTRKWNLDAELTVLLGEVRRFDYPRGYS